MGHLPDCTQRSNLAMEENLASSRIYDFRFCLLQKKTGEKKKGLHGHKTLKPTPQCKFWRILVEGTLAKSKVVKEAFPHVVSLSGLG